MKYYKDGKPYSGPKMSKAWYEANGYTTEAPEIVAPSIDTSAFDSACEAFKSVCSEIGALIGDTNFKGGFDEMLIFKDSPIYSTIEGLQLSISWSAANELCKYEGSKIGLFQPDWWYKCWGLEPGSLR